MPAKPQTKVISGAGQLVDDRRKEERHLVSLEKPVYVSWMQEESLLGRLVEMSRSGFRMAHQYRRFEAGQEVWVSLPWGRVRARVMWNRVYRRQVQTGFRMVENDGK